MLTPRETGEALGEPRPPYYGMLMFALGGDGALVPAQLDGDNEAPTAYAVRAGDVVLRISLINADLGRASQVAIETGRRFAQGSALRLAGPAADGSDVTFGGATLEDYGGWTATAKEPVQFTGTEFVVDVPEASGATVVLTPG